uniref:Casein kinase I n=1 Tax=Pyrodinium bahamense TaxID=73915 RepID=A0A7S0ALE6_9DINO|mmetsp:Transcript_3711/g.10218  ORF Transcript_3711/g.10218 Transcript_3711/m.10218 type:complete len:367 (+) Transcript_3711:3-1103(+)
MDEGKRVPHSVAGGRFSVLERIGSGCYGTVYSGIDVETNAEVAVKFESLAAQPRHQYLAHEVRIMQMLGYLKDLHGFANFYHAGKEQGYRCLVMERLGRSLSDTFSSCGGRFSVKTTVLVAEQVLRLLEYLHSRGVVHRDVKPENFLWGNGSRRHHLHLIDFGLSKVYYHSDRHAPMRVAPFTGTLRYASVSTHNFLQQSRRDDLEALGHMLIYFVRGSLPWQGCTGRTRMEKFELVKRLKVGTPLQQLCKGYPAAFEDYLSYCRRLGYKDRPDYDTLQWHFRSAKSALAAEVGRIRDHDFEWSKEEGDEQLAPLPRREDGLRQPDDPDLPPAREAKHRPMSRWRLLCKSGGRSAVAAAAVAKGGC